MVKCPNCGRTVRIICYPDGNGYECVVCDWTDAEWLGNKTSCCQDMYGADLSELQAADHPATQAACPLE